MRARAIDTRTMMTLTSDEVEHLILNNLVQPGNYYEHVKFCGRGPQGSARNIILDLSVCLEYFLYSAPINDRTIGFEKIVQSFNFFPFRSIIYIELYNL